MAKACRTATPFFPVVYPLYLWVISGPVLGGNGGLLLLYLLLAPLSVDVWSVVKRTLIR
jgi:hypothetical protein